MNRALKCDSNGWRISQCAPVWYECVYVWVCERLYMVVRVLYVSHCSIRYLWIAQFLLYCFIHHFISLIPQVKG